MPTVAYESGTAAFERRIGRRKPAEDLAVTWCVRPEDSGPNGHERVNGVVERPGRVVDVSVTGAAIDGPIDLPVRPGSQAKLRFRGTESLVTVCRYQATDQADTARYGVEFVSVDPALKDRVYRTIAEGRPDEAQWYLAR